jgi:PiT family inorganic phosphate transporter
MIFLVFVISLVLIFDFINGFHDSANSIATVVSTKVLTPFKAVLMAAFFNFLAYFIFSLKVATTMGKGVINPDVVNLTVIASAIISAIIWNLITWWLGLPSSSSHTLVGGLIGATIIKSGTSAVIFSGVIKIVLFIFISPLVGMILSYIISLIILHIFKNFTATKVDKWFRRLQLVSASLFSLGHGGNDAQKSMGIIWVALIVSGYASKSDPIDSWIVYGTIFQVQINWVFTYPSVYAKFAIKYLSELIFFDTNLDMPIEEIVTS